MDQVATVEKQQQQGRLRQERAAAVHHVTLVGAAVNLLLSIVKIVVGILAHSQALIADGIHSLSDLVTDALVMYATRLAHQEADLDHPYGHARIETVATVALGIFLILVAFALVLDAGRRMLQPELLVRPGFIALIVAGVSIAGKEWLYHYTMRVASRVNSGLLRANAWHHRTDAISSVVVLIGVGGALLGLPLLDAVAAVVVALMIVRVGWRLVWTNLEELVDKGLEPERLDTITEALESVGGVRSVHMLRTRRMGGQAFVDVHIQVPPRLSVSEGHQIADVAEARLLQQVDEVTDVTVHIDPEDDEDTLPNRSLPARSEIVRLLKERLDGTIGGESIVDVTLHYLAGRVDVDLVLPLSIAPTQERAAELSGRVRHAAEGAGPIRSVRVLYV